MQRFEYAGFGSGFGFSRAFQHGFSDSKCFNITLLYIKQVFDSKLASIENAEFRRYQLQNQLAIGGRFA